MASRTRVDPRPRRRPARAGLAIVDGADVARPRAARDATAGRRLAADEREHRTPEAGRPHPRVADDRRRRPAAPHVAVPVRPRRLRVVAGRHARHRPPRPGRPLRRARRAGHLAGACPRGRRHRRLRHADLLAPGALPRPRQRRGPAPRAGDARRRAGRPGDPDPPDRDVPGGPRLVDLRLERGGCDDRRPRRSGRLPARVARARDGRAGHPDHRRRRAAHRLAQARRGHRPGAAHR